jgi:hypothetical protein
MKSYISISEIETQLLAKLTHAQLLATQQLTNKAFSVLFLLALYYVLLTLKKI